MLLLSLFHLFFLLGKATYAILIYLHSLIVGMSVPLYSGRKDKKRSHFSVLEKWLLV